MKETLKVLSLFSGIGAFEKALENLNIDYELINYCEIDKYPAKAYSIIHNIPEDKNLCDIKNVDVSNLEDFDLMTWGFPCFEKGVMVLTDKGYKKIEHVKKGDLVLTHTNSYKEVLNTMNKKANRVYELGVSGYRNIRVTEEHPFYTLEVNKDTDIFKKPKWIKTKNLNNKCYIGININKESIIPKGKLEISLDRGKKDYIEVNFNDKEFWYFLGLYFRNGYLSKKNTSYHTVIIFDKKEAADLERVKKYLGKNKLKYKIVGRENSYKLICTNKNICLYIKHYIGVDRFAKRIKDQIINLPINYLKVFLEGYSLNQKEIFISNEYLAYSLQACFHKVYKKHLSIKNIYLKEQLQFMDIYKNKEYYLLNLKKDNNYFYSKGYVWVKVMSKKEKPYNDLVYNLEVEKDNSYTVQNMIVHNCNDLSVAGLKAGIKVKCEDCDTEFKIDKISKFRCPLCNSLNMKSSTRSGLYFEGLKILNEKKPKYSIIENVKGLVNKNNKESYETIMKDLESLGYVNYAKVLNSKDFGIPQNRERLFIVSIRKDLNQDFKFPEGFDNGLRLKDFLDKDVDSKYYMSEDKCLKVFKEIKDKIQIQDDNEIIKLINSSYIVNEEDNLSVIPIDDNLGNTQKIMRVKVSTDAINNKLDQHRRLYFPEGIAPTLLTSADTFKIINVGLVDLNAFEQTRRVYNPEGLSPTISTYQGGNSQAKIITYNIKPTVLKRKYNVDVEKLKETLIEHKNKSKLTNKEISEILVIQKTKVDHWFRKDSSFAIPDRDIWFKLKKILNIETDYFDKSITEFEERLGVFEQSQRIYDTDGLSPTLTTSLNGNFLQKDIETSKELNLDDISILPVKLIGPNNKELYIYYKLKVRKLTPKECLLLMGFSEEDYIKLREAGFSDNRLYKMAGNSIVVNILENIFLELLK